MRDILSKQIAASGAANDNETEFETARRHFVNNQAKALVHKIDRARFNAAWTMIGRIAAE